MNQKYKIILIIVIVLILGFWAFLFLKKDSRQPTAIEIEQPVATTTDSNLKTYRNEEWGFEFEYPEGWSFHGNTFYNLSSKFNLIGASPEENNNPNPIRPSILINIVTKDFSEKAAMDRERMGARISNISIDGVPAIKYEYMEQTPKISIDVSREQSNFIVSSPEKHEDVLNQILSSFKFLKKIIPYE